MSEGEQNVVDNYQLVNCIAQGTHSQIWEVTEQGGGQSFAMKLLQPDALKESEQVQVLKHETKVAKTLEHPNFVKVHKSAFTKKHGYMLMDYFRAPNLKTLILNDPLSVHVRIRKLIESLSMALGYMHEKGWVHRDIKPDNVLFNKGSELRLIDFSLSVRVSGGLSKLLGGKIKTIQGTRTYIAPETILKKPATPQTDMYSMGVTLFELLTGQPPFKGSSPNDLLQKHLTTKPVPPSSINPNVTPEMDRFVLRLLSKKPSDRHKTTHEMFAEFRSLQVFKEDVADLAEKTDAERKRKEFDTLSNFSSRVNSRADALRTETGQSPAKAAKPKPRPKPAPAAAPAAQAPPPQFAPPAGWGYAPQPGPPPAYPYPPPPQGAPYAWPPPGAPQAYPPQPGPPPPGPPQPGPPPAYPPAGYPQQIPVYHPPSVPQAQAAPPAVMAPAAPPPGAEAVPQPSAPPAGPVRSGEPAPLPRRPIAPTSSEESAEYGTTFQFAVDEPAAERKKRPASDEDLPLMEDLPDVV